MGYYSAFDAHSRLNTANLIQVTREDANNFLIYLPIPGEANAKIRARFRLRIIETAWHIAGLAMVDLNGTAATVTLMDHTSKVEYAFRLGKAGDTEPEDESGAFAFIGGVHGHQQMTSAALTVDGKSITSLPTGASAWGNTAVMTQAINGLYPPADAVTAVVSTLVHTITSDRLRMDVSHAFNSAEAWQIYTHYGCMLPALNTGCDTYQVEGHEPAAIVSDGNWKQSGTEATWCEFSDTGHDYAMRVTMPYGGPNVAGDWSLSDALLCGVQDRVDGIAKFYAFNVSAAFADRLAAAGVTVASRSEYTVSKG